MDREIVFVDQDTVLAKLVPKWLEVFGAETGIILTEDEIKDWDITTHIPQHLHQHFMSIIERKKFYVDLEVVDHAIEVTRLLQEKYRVVIATDALSARNSLKSKYDWLKTNFPHIDRRDIVYLGSKGLLRGHYLIDDGPHNLEAFEKNRAIGTEQGLLFDAPCNRSEHRFTRVEGWVGVGKFFGVI